MLRLINTEFFKLRKRWLPYVLLLVLVLSVLLPVVLGYINYNDTLKNHPELADVEITMNPDGSVSITGLPQPESGSMYDYTPGMVARQLASWKNLLVLPGAMQGVFSSVPGLGMVLVIILAASIFGNEYGWGTVRQSIARGNSRLVYFAAKLSTAAIGTAGGIVCAVLAGLAATTVTSLAVEGSIAWGGFAPYFFASLGRSLLVVMVYLAMAAFFAVALRSAMAGMAVAVAWFLGESIILALLSMSTGWLAEAGQYFISYNTGQLMSFSFAGGSETGLWKAVVILLACILVFAFSAYAVFRRQDLTA